jgi:hypothetical protein
MGTRALHSVKTIPPTPASFAGRRRCDPEAWFCWFWFFLSPLYFVIPFTARHDLFRDR